MGVLQIVAESLASVLPNETQMRCFGLPSNNMNMGIEDGRQVATSRREAAVSAQSPVHSKLLVPRSYAGGRPQATHLQHVATFVISCTFGDWLPFVNFEAPGLTRTSHKKVR